MQNFRFLKNEKINDCPQNYPTVEIIEGIRSLQLRLFVKLFEFILLGGNYADSQK